MVCTLFAAVLLFAATLAHEPSFMFRGEGYGRGV